MDTNDAAAIVYTTAQLHAMGRYTPDADDLPAVFEALREERGRQIFATGGGLVSCDGEGECRGWHDGHREAYAAGVVAFLRWDADPNPDKGDADNPHRQFSGAWEAWADGFEAEAAREPASPPLPR